MLKHLERKFHVCYSDTKQKHWKVIVKNKYLQDNSVITWWQSLNSFGAVQNLIRLLNSILRSLLFRHWYIQGNNCMFMFQATNCECQIVNLGAGFDTTYWTLKDEGISPKNFIEVDFPGVTEKKCHYIKVKKPLLEKLTSEGMPSNGTIAFSPQTLKSFCSSWNFTRFIRHARLFTSGKAGNIFACP